MKKKVVGLSSIIVLLLIICFGVANGRLMDIFLMKNFLDVKMVVH